MPTDFWIALNSHLGDSRMNNKPKSSNRHGIAPEEKKKKKKKKKKAIIL